MRTTISKRPQRAGSDRDSEGRFRPGHRIKSPGNPAIRKLAAWREAFARAVTDRALERIVARLVKEADGGEQWAVELVLAYCLGKPAAFAELEILPRLERLENASGGMQCG